MLFVTALVCVLIGVVCVCANAPECNVHVFSSTHTHISHCKTIVFLSRKTHSHVHGSWSACLSFGSPMMMHSSPKVHRQSSPFCEHSMECFPVSPLHGEQPNNSSEWNILNISTEVHGHWEFDGTHFWRNDHLNWHCQLATTTPKHHWMNVQAQRTSIASKISEFSARVSKILVYISSLILKGMSKTSFVPLVQWVIKNSACQMQAKDRHFTWNFQLFFFLSPRSLVVCFLTTFTSTSVLSSVQIFCFFSLFCDNRDKLSFPLLCWQSVSFSWLSKKKFLMKIRVCLPHYSPWVTTLAEDFWSCTLGLHLQQSADWWVLCESQSWMKPRVESQSRTRSISGFFASPFISHKLPTVRGFVPELVFLGEVVYQ